MNASGGPARCECGDMSAAQLDASLCGNQDANVSHWLSEDPEQVHEREGERGRGVSEPQNLSSVCSLAQLTHSLGAFEQGAR